MNKTKGTLAGLAAVALLSGCGQSAPASYKCAVARVAHARSDLVPGPLARGVGGDLVIENDKLRAIIQKGGRNWYGISQFGGNIIDALPKAASGALLGQDQFEEFVLGTNIESAPNYQSVKVISAGGEDATGNCVPAVVRASGPDDLLDFINGSTAITGAGLFYPPSADDYDLPFTITTDYTLAAGKRYIRIDTRLVNESAQDHRIYLVEYTNGSGEVEVFQSGYGFGEAFVTAPCTSCNFVAYAGHEGGAGVSYGVIHNYANTTSVSVSGVTVLLYGRDLLLVASNPAQHLQSPTDPQADPGTAGPNFTVPANGEITLTRYFAVGDGTVASIVDVRNELFPPAGGVGTLEGRVTDAKGPVEGAEIAVMGPSQNANPTAEGFPAARGPTQRVLNHFRTDAHGRFRGTQAAGSYTLRVNMPGRLTATPTNPSVTVTAGQATVQDFTLPVSSRIRVLVHDDAGRPVAAKVQLVGAPNPADPDAAADALNGEALVGQAVTIESGVFGDPGADPLPPGILLAEFAVRDPLGHGPVGIGDTGELPVEPGTYQLSVSHGPRYSEVRKAVTIGPGLTTVQATLAEVVPTPGHVFGDFHVHTINSPDSEVTNRERVATYVAEDMDFFTPSDHDMRVDFAPVVDDMGLDGLIATAPSAEVTTFDYGHFGFWPVAIEKHSPDDELPGEGHSHDPKISRGSIDWGGLAPLGEDFESSGRYVLSPAQIFAEAGRDPLQPGRQVVRQINHIDWHFGTEAGGLSIDTATDPPQSAVTADDRRLDPAIVNFYSDDYDTLELLIGTDGLLYPDEAEGTFYTENLGDWFNLLNQGRFRTAVSNSDTHKRRITSLHTRNLISVPDELLREGRANSPAIGADPHTVGDAVRRGLSTMTNTPFLQVRVRNGAGRSAGLRFKDAYGTSRRPLPAASGTVEVQVEVQAPLWAPYDQIMVFANGETLRHDDDARRYALCAPDTVLNLVDGDFTRTEAVAPAAITAKRFETSQAVTVSRPGEDFWIVVLVRGTPGDSPTMYPVYPDAWEAGADGTAGTVDDIGVRALAMSNPIYVDVDGNGRWDPPGTAATVHDPLGCTALPTE